MRVLVIIGYYLPGFQGGGSIRTLANQVEYLGDEIEFDILTADRDWRSPAPYDGVRHGEWTAVGKARVRYLAPHEWSLRNIARIIRSTPHDVLYLNSLFSPFATVRPLILRRFGALPPVPVILGPRGELAAGAMSTRSLKKRIWLWLARGFGLFREILWQASTASEAADIRRELGAGAQVVEAIDCSPSYREWGPAGKRPAKRPGGARICMVSRVAQTKNVEFAIELLQGIEGDVEFGVYGPVESEDYWRRCEAVISTLPPNVRVVRHGAVPHSDLGCILGAHDLLLLPTLSENFGHTIIEAMAAGCPVLISDRTPWRGLRDAGVGWDVPLEDAAEFRNIIRAVVDMPEEEHAAMRTRARDYALRASDPGLAIEQNRAMFHYALTHDSKR